MGLERCFLSGFCLDGEKIALSGEELEEFEGDETEPFFNFAFEPLFPPGLYFDFATENSEGSDLRFDPNFSSGFCLEGEKMAASETGSVLPSTELRRVEPVVNGGGREAELFGKDLSLRKRDSSSVGRRESVKPEQLMAETCSRTQRSWAWEMRSSTADSSVSER